MKQDWLHEFDLLRTLSTAEQSLLNRSVQHKYIPAGNFVFQNGQPCHHILFVQQGCIRIQKLSEDGHLLTIARVSDHHCCEISVTSAITGDVYPAEAITEDDSHIILIPSSTVRQLMSTSASWQYFLFQEIGKYFNDLILLAEDVAFVPIDIRLARRLVEGINTTNKLHKTHHEIASDLGTAREVVSRTLKRFEHVGFIKLHRGWIEIINPDALKSMFH